MFTPEEIQTRARVRPFQPFQIKTSDGESYEVRHPDLIWIGRRFVCIGILGPRSQQFFEKEVRIALMHITAIEDLPPVSASNSPAAE